MAFVALAACSSSSSDSPAGPSDADTPEATPQDPEADDGGPPASKNDGGSKDAGTDAAPQVPVGVATKIVDAPVRDYALVDDGILVVQSGVKKTDFAGANASAFPNLPNAGAIEVDGGRVYAIASTSIISATLAGADPRTHATNVKDVYAFRVSGANAYISQGFEDDAVGVVRVPLDGSARTTLFPGVNARSHGPIFAANRVFAVDYGKPVTIGNSRNGGVWFSTGSGAPTKVTSGDYGQIGSFASMTTDGTDVYARTSQGVVKWSAATVTAGAAPTIVVPKASCSASGYTVEDVLAVDASSVYTVCDSADKKSYEVRAYSKSSGQLTKILGAVPVYGYGFVQKLRQTPAKVYFMARQNDYALYSAPK
jgi:hypothetical protein